MTEIICCEPEKKKKKKAVWLGEYWAVVKSKSDQQLFNLPVPSIAKCKSKSDNAHHHYLSLRWICCNVLTLGDVFRLFSKWELFILIYTSSKTKIKNVLLDFTTE